MDHFDRSIRAISITRAMRKQQYSSLSIIIPAYNEEAFISQTIQGVLEADTEGLKKEIIVVNDGSSDQTVKKAQAYMSTLGKSAPKARQTKGEHSITYGEDTIILIDKKANEGKGAAVKTGFLACTGDIALVQDADLEYDPTDYPRLLEPFLHDDADVVFGSRFMSDRPHRVLYFWHFVGNTLLTLISNMCTDLNLTDMETGYKVFRGELIRSLAPGLESTRFGFEPEITAKVARNKENRIFEVGIAYRGRTYKEGKKLLWWKDGVEALFKIIYFNFFK
jgi:glycosyltransferase involved in cell wall biosynthesis